MNEARHRECQQPQFHVVFVREAEQGKYQDKQYQIPTEGPGTELKKILAGWFWRLIGVRMSVNCKCQTRMRLMNAEGPQWCRENVETIVDGLREQHEQQGIRVPFVRFVARRLVMKAIRRAERMK